VLPISADVDGDVALADWPMRRAEDLRESPMAADLFIGSAKRVAD
jgi:hypothetical protein